MSIVYKNLQFISPYLAKNCILAYKLSSFA